MTLALLGTALFGLGVIRRMGIVNLADPGRLFWPLAQHAR
jgi:hypothetical protein